MFYPLKLKCLFFITLFFLCWTKQVTDTHGAADGVKTAAAHTGRSMRETWFCKTPICCLVYVCVFVFIFLCLTTSPAKNQTQVETEKKISFFLDAVTSVSRSANLKDLDSRKVAEWGCRQSVREAGWQIIMRSGSRNRNGNLIPLSESRMEMLHQFLFSPLSMLLVTPSFSPTVSHPPSWQCVRRYGSQLLE